MSSRHLLKWMAPGSFIRNFLDASNVELGTSPIRTGNRNQGTGQISRIRTKTRDRSSRVVCASESDLDEYASAEPDFSTAQLLAKNGHHAQSQSHRPHGEVALECLGESAEEAEEMRRHKLAVKDVDKVRILDEPDPRFVSKDAGITSVLLHTFPLTVRPKQSATLTGMLCSSEHKSMFAANASALFGIVAEVCGCTAPSELDCRITHLKNWTFTPITDNSRVAFVTLDKASNRPKRTREKNHDAGHTQ